MTYTYRFIPASMTIQPKAGNSPKNVYVELFEETVRDQFYNSSNWWTIEEETAIGSEIYENVDVRIAHVINAETGLKLGDDWKTVLFQDSAHPIEIGKRYRFDDNIWLTVNKEAIKNLSVTCTIRRCNNTLRWIDEQTGAYYEEPCAIEYLVKEPRDYMTQGSPFVTPGGFLHIETQLNERTNKIKENQRFLFGGQSHWTCYKVVGTGLNDFKNEKTYDNESAKILSVDLIANFVNPELDDVVNGIADVYTNVYILSLNKNSASGSPSGTIELIPTIIYNGDTVSRTVEWSTSNNQIATVSASGIVTLITTGSCIITANIENNPTSASCLITVSASPSINNEIRVTPDTNYVLEGMTRTYDVYAYQNDIQQADTFTITCNRNGVPSTSYVFSQTGNNSFSVQNVARDVSSYLTIQAVSSGSITRDFNIYLRGGW